MITYDSADIYIEEATSIKDKITRIEAVINALLTTATQAAASDNIGECWLDDSQTKIKTTYRGTEAVFKSIEAFERLKQYYISKLTPSVIRLIDSKSLYRR